MRLTNIIAGMSETEGVFRPSGVITLTTDFGLTDPFVGIVKGVISNLGRELKVIDLCHEAPPFDPAIAGLWVGLSYHWFPPGSVHVAVVDPGVGSDRRIVCLLGSGHAFLVPDNGLAGELSCHLENWTAWTLQPETLSLDVPSSTFHGRDIFAPVAAKVASGLMAPAELGPAAVELLPSRLPRATRGPDWLDGEILLADRFGNLFTNIRGPLPDDWQGAVVTVGNRSMRLVRTYDEARNGEFIGVFNSFGLLEIAVPRASARQEGRWPAGTAVRLSRTG